MIFLVKNYLFENKKYDLVRVFEKTDSKGKFKKLIIAQDVGIVGLIDIYGNIWNLKTSIKTKMLNEQKNIVITKVSC